PNGIQGQLIVAGKATDLGNGSWHYEYAVQNVTSDRSGQSVTIDCPSGVTLSNIGFHDVDYHDGDGANNGNCDGTDWTATVGGGGVTWASQTYDQNPNANALRWDTVYNFRFDANTAPAMGGITITLFKPGSPTSVSTGGLPVPGSVPVVPGDLDGDGHVGLT